MSDETTRLLALLDNGSDAAVLDNAAEIAGEMRRLARLARAVEVLDENTDYVAAVETRGGWGVRNGEGKAVLGATLADALCRLADEVTP